MNSPAQPVPSIVHFTKDMEEQLYAHVLAKRTYRLRDGRAAEVAPEQLAVVRELVRYNGDEASPVEWEPDIFACSRGGTDLVVQGQAHCPSGPRRTLDVTVTVQPAGGTREVAEKAARRIRVFGDRKVVVTEGDVSFSEPELFESMPLSYRRSYGGHDHAADAAHPSDYAVWLAKASGSPVADFSPYSYARNPMGTGYVVYAEKNALDGLVLPNLEMLGDLLTPERLVLGSPERWPSAPRPAGFDWHDQDWFPRAAFLGIFPAFEGSAGDIPEVREGYLTADLLEGEPLELLTSMKQAPRFFHGASPWLMLPELSGGESIRVDHMHPTIPHLEISMPRETPQMMLELSGGSAKELRPALRTVIIRPDKETLVCVWVGTMAVDRPPTETQLEKTRHAVRWKR